MNTLQRINVWGRINHPFWVDYLRILFGIALVAKGMFFIYNSTELVRVVQLYNTGHADLLAYSIAWIHIIGGLFIAIGLITRIALWFQLPILVGAVFFISAHRDMVTGNGGFLIPVIILLLLILFLVEGPGKFSVDAMIDGKAWTIKSKGER